MSFGAMELMAVMMALTGIRPVRELIRYRHETFDADYTVEDRRRVLFAALFILVPISVLLHEGGHAVMVRWFGGEITGFGFYFFAGYVSYLAAFTPAQVAIVAVAGSFVNVVLAALAFAFVVLRRPPMRAAVNDLLFNFIGLSLANTLLFYPLLDFATGMEGDFHQMYFEGPRNLAIGIAVVHIAILAVFLGLLRSERFLAYKARLTGQPPGAISRLGFRPRGTALDPRQRLTAIPEEQPVREAIARVAGGWPFPIQTGMQRRPDGVLFTLGWSPSDRQCVVALFVAPGGPMRLMGMVSGSAEGATRFGEWPQVPSADLIVPALRRAMELVQARAETGAAAAGSSPSISRPAS